MDSLEKILYPVAAVGAIVGLYVALKKPATGPTVSNQVSPAGAGLTNYTPQAVSYQVNPPQLAAPTQVQLLGNPYNPNPALPANQQYQTPPPYLAFNFGPGHDLSKIPLTDEQIAQLNGQRPTQQSTSGCGGNCNQCQNACADDPNHSIFPDGRGGFLAKNGHQLVQKLNRQDPAWPARAAYNIAGSDVTPETLPFPGQTQPSAQQPSPAAPNQTLAPSAPGAGVVNDPNVSSSVNPNIRSVFSLGSLNQFGNQVLRLSADQISRATGVRWTS